jgi:hypothetical protein
MKPQNPDAASSGLINDVVAPPPAVAPAEVPLAEPPKEATFVEAPIDAPVAPKEPVTPVAELAKELPTPEAKSTAAVVKALPPKAAREPNLGKPVFAIAFVAVLFVALTAVALYAYSKTA